MTITFLRVYISLLLFIVSSIASCVVRSDSKISDNVVETLHPELMPDLDESIWAIYQDQNNNYWFGSNGNGVIVYDGKTFKRFTTSDGLVDNTIRDIQGDHFGNVFIGTPDGVSKYDGTKFTTLKPIASSSSQWKSEPNDLWFNCNGNNIYRYDGDKLYELQLPRQDLGKAFGIEVKGVPFKGMNNSPYAVYGIDKDKEGNVWLGTVAAGAFRYDGTSFLWIGEKELSTLPDGRLPGVRSILEDKNGYMWLSNFISKYRISDRDSKVEYEKLEGISKSEEHFQNRLPYYNSGLSDRNGDLWMTTYGGGVWKYDGDRLLNFPIKIGETEVLIISIYEDNKGVLWLGTDNAGVWKQDGESFKRF